MQVVKIGGSLACSDNLLHWLRVLAEADSLIIVPGGGPFAEQVRAAQAHWKFDDSTAHQMALIAMEQYGRMLCALQPGLYPAASKQEILGLLRQHKVPVWMPANMVLTATAVAHSWDVTSDSLAAWLCRLLSADALLLVKSAPARDLDGSATELRRRGLVDRAFPGFVEQGGFSFQLLSADDAVGWQKRVLLSPTGHSERSISENTDE